MDYLVNKEEFFERESLYLDIKYSDDIQELYFYIKEYLDNNCLQIMEKITHNDLQDICFKHSSIYDMFYEDEIEEEDDLLEYEW